MQDNEVTATSREQRNRDIALHHANLIQQRKDVEAEILASTETLLDLPSQQYGDATRPCTDDVTLVERSLLLFQHSDYDALIEERNIDGRCGYVVCPRQKRQQDTKSRFRIKHGKGDGASDVEFVAKSDLERWCSLSCEKYSSYLRKQLSSEPAWARQHGGPRTVQLWRGSILPGNRVQDESALTKGMEQLDLGSSGHDVLEKMRSLAIERGGGDRSNMLLNRAEVKENDAARHQVPVAPGDSLLPDSIEGYRPKGLETKASQSPSAEPEAEDLLESI